MLRSVRGQSILAFRIPHNLKVSSFASGLHQSISLRQATPPPAISCGPTSIRSLSMASSEASNRPSSIAAGVGTETSVFLVTSPDNSTSRKIAESILTKKLAACVNLVPKITSMYVR